MYLLFAVLISGLTIITQPIKGSADDFSFKEYWNFPIPPQGLPPKSFSDLEASLDPDDCGICHETQYSDWKTSRHSKAMGAGVAGQLHSPWLDDKTISICGYCHAPLAEQSPFKGLPDGHFTRNPDYLPDLRFRGITCGGCHVRRHIRYGPKPLTPKVDNPPHNSFVEVENFGDSEFCKPCHQFNPRDNRVNGKLLQNTYEEWKNSSYSKNGIQCTDCHMPGRRHIWRGIHNRDMAKKGVNIKTKHKGSKIFLEILNNGVGHNFPTYVTPKIIIRGSVIDKKGKELQQTVQEKFIGWDISLNLSEERYDTRIPPGEKFSATFSINSPASGLKYRLVIRVFPDDFYTRFFKTLLDNPPDGIDLKKIKEAYNDSLESSYILFEKYWDI